jgi:membrane-bound serine protease (ClpP class)
MSTFGVLLMVVGATLMVAEAHMASHGVLGTVAATALAVGVALVLSGAGAPGAAILGAGLAVAVAGLWFAWLILRKGLAARRLRVRSGPRSLVGRVATVRTVPAPFGRVQLDGTLWRARLGGLENDEPVAEGMPVVVERVDGLTLTVRPAEEWEVVP